MIIPLVISSIVIGITLGYASLLDIRERRVPFRTWYPMLAISVPMALWTYVLLLTADLRFAFGYILLVLMFTCLFYTSSAYLHLFGGADAWALIFITVCVPVFPIQPVFGYPILDFFPFTVLINAVILNLITPLAIFVMNVMKGNRGPLQYMLIGFPVDGRKIEEYFGFVMEELYEVDGKIERRFIGFGESIKRMISGKRRMYTQDLKKYPEEYAEELSLYRRTGKVWISYGVPFMIPITAGFVTAIFVGDLLYILMEIICS